MAKLTKNEEYIVDMYVRYFGRAADAATIKSYAEDKKTSVILKNIIADADAEKAELSTSDFVNNAFQNLFGRDATTKDMNKYSKVVDKGKDLPINAIVKSAAKADNAVYNNKKAVALKYAELGGTEQLDLSKISKGNLVDLNFLNTVTKAADLEAKIDTLAENSGIPSSFDGKTFVLTTGVDAGKDFIGTNKDDQFIADNSVTGKVNGSAADTLDGGKGEDTFKLYDDASVAGATTTGSLPTLKNIENVVIYDNTNAVAAVDLTKWDSVETLFLERDANTFGYTLGGKVTTVNLEDVTANQVLNFDNALTAATVGVNKVGTTAAATTVTVDSATATGALKTLTINASGKASEVNLDQTAATIETLNITGRADLALDFLAPAGSKIVTIDGSKAQGKLDLDLANTTAATLKTVKTGTGDDKLALSIAVASGTTIDLGAGNDKLVAGTAGSVVTSTTTVIDGGAGIDSLDAALVNAGNAGVFKNFETISLNAAAGTTLDLDLLTKSTITSIAKDADAAHTLINVKKSQSLTVNNNAAGKATTLTFKASEVAGTADAYTINFNADNAAGDIDAGTVTINGIETVTVNSLGKTSAATDTNKITLVDANAKSLVITGDKALTVAFDTAFGTAGNATNGLGVSTIDASASTAGITLGASISNLKTAWSGLTIKGGAGKDAIDVSGLTLSNPDSKIIVNAGAGDDTITVDINGGTLTGGAGKDTFNIAASKVGANTTEATGVVKVTITDLTAGDKIIFADKGTEVFNKTKLDVSTASNLDDALDLALGGNGSTNGIINWFQYAGNTYIVEDVTAAAVALAPEAQAGDIVVKINGIVDLTNSTLSGVDLTIA